MGKECELLDLVLLHDPLVCQGSHSVDQSGCLMKDG